MRPEKPHDYFRWRKYTALRCSPARYARALPPFGAATGTVGSLVVANLSAKGAKVHALTRSPEKARFGEGVVTVAGDLMDVDAMRANLAKASTLFLLNAISPAELFQALITLNLAREVGIKRVVHLSVFNGETYANVPHFTAKVAVERMIERCEIPATILRASYFINNDIRLKDPLGHGVYPMPIGEKGLSMIDTRDIAEIAALELLRREKAADTLPTEVLNLVGPEVQTGASIAQIWTEELGKTVRYGGDDIGPFVQRIKANAPAAAAYSVGLMMTRFQQDGMVGDDADVQRLTKMLGRKLRTYRDFAKEATRIWNG